MTDAARRPIGRAPGLVQAPIPAAAAREQGSGAGIATRVIADAVDAAAIAGVLAGGYVVIATATLLAKPRRFTFPAPSLTLVITIGLLGVLAYLTTCWTLTGRTLGDRFIGLKVVSKDGLRLHVMRAAARAFLCVLFPIGLVWCAVDMRRRSVQDLLLRTAVVYDWPEP